jgi:hypothetical protein
VHIQTDDQLTGVFSVTLITVAIGGSSIKFQPTAGLVIRDSDKKLLTTTSLLNTSDHAVERELTVAGGVHDALALI